MDEAKADFDVLIIGGGPAGLSAALWCSDLGLSALLLERESEMGGQLLIINNSIKNYLGLDARNGREMRDTFARKVNESKADLRLNSEVTEIDPVALTVSLADGTKFSGKAIVIATGVRRRKLNIPGEAEFVGRGILDSGVTSKDKVAGKEVVIIGGGDAALENAIILSETASRVTVVHRRKIFTARNEFVQRVKVNSRIKLITDAVVTSIGGSERVQEVSLLCSDTPITIAADAVLIRIGVIPNTSLVDGFTGEGNFGQSPDGYSNRACNMFLIGDVKNELTPTISSAVGDGASVSKILFRKLTST